MRNKKAVSLMVSYILLVAIALTLSVIVGSWVYFQAKNPPVGSTNCEGVTVTADSFCCYLSNGAPTLNFTLINNGRFTSDKVLVRFEILPDGDVFRYSFPKFNSSILPNNRTNYSVEYVSSGGVNLFNYRGLKRVMLIPTTGALCSENSVILDLPSDCNLNIDNPIPPTECIF